MDGRTGCRVCNAAPRSRRPCEHAFVSTTDFSRFVEAIRYADLNKAIDAAERLREDGEPLSLYDALELLMLMVHVGDPRAQAAGERWLERLEEGERSDPEIAMARAAVDGLRLDDRRVWVRCERTLKMLAV